MDGLGSASAHGALNRALDLLPTAEMDDNKALPRLQQVHGPSTSSGSEHSASATMDSSICLVSSTLETCLWLLEILQIDRLRPLARPGGSERAAGRPHTKHNEG